MIKRHKQGMKPTNKVASRPRSWPVSIGNAQAPDERAAAVAQFDLDQEQRKRLVVREQE
jgi:hypothetical protein